MQIKPASIDYLERTIKRVNDFLSDGRPITGMTKPSLICLQAHIEQIKRGESSEGDAIFVALDNNDSIVGYVSGGLSVDNEDFEAEIYLLFSLMEDNDLAIRTLLFNSIAEHFTRAGHSSLHVEITSDDPNRMFYLSRKAKFITDIENHGAGTMFISSDFGWSDIREL